MKGNKLYEKIKLLESDIFLDIQVCDSDELNQIIYDLSHLNDYDLSFCKKGIDIKILNTGSESLTIYENITGNIPDNISVIRFPECYLKAYIEKLTHKGKLYFSNITLNKFRIKEANIGEIEFGNIDKHDSEASFGVWHKNNIGKLLIRGGKNIDEIKLDGTGSFKNNITSISLSFVEVKLLELRDNKLKNIDITDCILDHFLFFDKDIDAFEIDNTTIHYLTSISSSNGKKLTIKDSYIRELNMRDVYFHSIIIERVSHISKDVYSIIRVEYSSLHGLSEFDATNYTFTKLVNIDKIKITSNNDELNKSYKLGLSFKNVRFNENDRSSYYLGGLSVDKLNFTNCTNLSDFFELNNININNLAINDFNLGNAVLNNISIKKKILLKSPILNDCIFNGINFPNDYRIEISTLSNKQLKDTYRQLKHVMDKNSNYTDANKFFEREMEYHMYYLSEKKLFNEGWLQDLKNNGFSGRTGKLMGERISLKLGYVISEFGNNWIFPIFLILLLSFLTADIFYLYDNFDREHLLQLNIFNLGIQSLLYIFSAYIIFKFYKTSFKIISIIFIIGFTLYVEFYKNYPIIKSFLEFLYPFRGLLDYEYLKGLPLFKLFIFIIYKLMYAVLIWHFIIALKRTTKR